MWVKIEFDTGKVIGINLPPQVVAIEDAVKRTAMGLEGSGGWLRIENHFIREEKVCLISVMNGTCTTDV